MYKINDVYKIIDEKENHVGFASGIFIPNIVLADKAHTYYGVTVDIDLMVFFDEDFIKFRKHTDQKKSFDIIHEDEKYSFQDCWFNAYAKTMKFPKGDAVILVDSSIQVLELKVRK